MPAKSPRIFFTPTRRSYELLSRMHRTTGQPLSACAREMMETLEDHLAMLVHVLEQAKALNNGARQAAAAAAEEAAVAMHPLLEEAARVMLKMAKAMDEPTLPLDALPPTSNTGATSDYAASAQGA